MLTIVLSAIFAVLTGFGLATMILGGLLNKSNNIGDAPANVSLHNTYARNPRFDLILDRCPSEECKAAAARYDVVFPAFPPNPPADVEARAFDPSVETVDGKPVEYVEVRDTAAKKEDEPFMEEQYDFDEELPPIDGPIFKPLS